jgi:hypothetical protein
MSDERHYEQEKGSPATVERGFVNEKGVAPGYVVPMTVGDDGDDRYHFSSADTDLVQRRLKQRHIQMYVTFDVKPRSIILNGC